MSNATEARRLLRSHRYGVLSTLSKKLNGFPFGSITPYLVDHDGSLLILISGLAEHTKNIQHDPRVSLITHNQSDPNIQMQGRVTVTGNAHRLPDQQQPISRYLRHFPEAANYLEMPDFAFYRIQPLAIRYIGGVGRIHWVRMEDYAPTQTATFLQHEETLLLEINAQRQGTLLRLLHQPHDVQAIGLDCDGLDVRSNDQVWRLDFAETLTGPVHLSHISALLCHLP